MVLTPNDPRKPSLPLPHRHAGSSCSRSKFTFIIIAVSTQLSDLLVSGSRTMSLGCAQMGIRVSFLALQSAIPLNDTALSRDTPSSLLLVIRSQLEGSE